MFLNPTALVPSTVQLDNVPEVGVPRTGVTNVGLVDKTLEPEPVDEVTPVPPLATARVPEEIFPALSDVRDAPDPEKPVAVAVPVTVTPVALVAILAALLW